ncbi:MAG TPA: 16S rRNA (cytosine(1402)-N(4))-methyltransferase RsmH [Candidatus Saccharimonadales bacterium]
MTNNGPHNLHLPVLLEEVLEVLSPQVGESYLDVTAGYGGHAAEVLARTQAPEKATLVDRDENAINELTERFAGMNVNIRRQDFLSASEDLRSEGQQFDLILADLGVSSPHLNQAERGFAISMSGPLDMRMDQSQALTAEQVVNTYSKEQLTDILARYGEEPKAGAIAKLIVQNRPLHTTSELAELASRVWPGHSRVHPATRTFQALRIAVNDELGLLQRSLPVLLDLLAPGGRLAIISFHSLEDRLVKQFFAEQGGDRYDASLRILTKRPLTASATESVSNPRARSAKLRAAVKIKR